MWEEIAKVVTVHENFIAKVDFLDVPLHWALLPGLVCRYALSSHRMQDAIVNLLMGKKVFWILVNVVVPIGINESHVILAFLSRCKRRTKLYGPANISVTCSAVLCLQWKFAYNRD